MKPSTYLRHHGIKGMHWGRRNNGTTTVRGKLASTLTRGKPTHSPEELDQISKSATKLKGSLFRIGKKKGESNEQFDARIKKEMAPTKTEMAKKAASKRAFEKAKALDQRDEAQAKAKTAKEHLFRFKPKNMTKKQWIKALEDDAKSNTDFQEKIKAIDNEKIGRGAKLAKKILLSFSEG